MPRPVSTAISLARRGLTRRAAMSEAGNCSCAGEDVKSMLLVELGSSAKQGDALLAASADSALTTATLVRLNCTRNTSPPPSKRKIERPRLVYGAATCGCSCDSESRPMDSQYVRVIRTSQIIRDNVSRWYCGSAAPLLSAEALTGRLRRRTPSGRESRVRVCPVARCCDR